MGISSYTRIKLFSLSSKVSGWRRLVGDVGGPEISCAIETNETVTNIKYVAPSAVELYVLCNGEGTPLELPAGWLRLAVGLCPA